MEITPSEKEIKDFKCFACNKKLKCSLSMPSHTLKCQPYQLIMSTCIEGNTCIICGKSFAKIKHVRRHVLTHDYKSFMKENPKKSAGYFYVKENKSSDEEEEEEEEEKHSNSVEEQQEERRYKDADTEEEEEELPIVYFSADNTPGVSTKEISSRQDESKEKPITDISEMDISDAALKRMSAEIENKRNQLNKTTLLLKRKESDDEGEGEEDNNTVPFPNHCIACGEEINDKLMRSHAKRCQIYQDIMKSHLEANKCKTCGTTYSCVGGARTHVRLSHAKDFPYHSTKMNVHNDEDELEGSSKRKYQKLQKDTTPNSTTIPIILYDPLKELLKIFAPAMLAKILTLPEIKEIGCKAVLGK